MAVDIRSLYLDQGLSTLEIARMLGCSSSTVSRRLRKAGVEIRPPGGVKKKLASKTIRRLYEEGRSAPYIASKLGCSTNVVYSRLVGMGVEIRSSGGQNKVQLDDDLLRELYIERKLSIQDVAKRVGHSPQVVGRHLQRMSVSRKPWEENKRRDLDSSEIARLYGRGLSTYQVANLLGCCYSTISSRLREMGIRVRTRAEQHRIDVDEDEVVRLYSKCHMTTSEISSILGVSADVVRSRLRENSVPRRPPGHFGSVRVFRHHGHPVKLGSGWEAQVYSILWREFGEDFLFQGEFGERKHKCTPRFRLDLADNLPERYQTKKDHYGWHPDFVIPDLDMVIEVKGGWKVRQRWNQCVIPCLKTTDFPHAVYGVLDSPYKVSTWDQLRNILTPY